MGIDRKAFRHLSYGLFLLTAQRNGKDNGCIINTAIQAASDPQQISICCIKGNLTQEMIHETGTFNLSILPESTPFAFFQRFGMASGHDVDKFAGETVQRTANGLAFEPNANAVLSCTVQSRHDLGSHWMYLATVDEAIRLNDEPSATYAYYQNVTKKGGASASAGADAGASAAPTAPAAPVAEALPSKTEAVPAPAAGQGRIIAWRCTICGYVYEGAELPEDFLCPLCGHDAEDFEPVFAPASETTAPPAQAENKPEQNAKSNETEGGKPMKWVCKVCGYVHEGDEPPAECPVCRTGAENFEKVEGELTLAAEHEYGVYAKTVKDNPNISDADKTYIFEQLKANFTGECSEVGMYLCMARIAHREGYPEIGLYWEKAAFEEAEHAAKFAELLGEDLEPNMKASTKENLAWRVDCEFGATAGKTELAACAKKNGLDAIHDTVHEMARDEARHGRALKGLLERYF